MSPVAEHALRPDYPRRSMGVLRTILTYARQIPLDVSRVVRSLVERGIQQHDQLSVAPHEPLIYASHRQRAALRLARTGHYTPALRYRIDIGFVTLAGTQWITIVIVRAYIPFAVPCVGLNRAVIPLRKTQKLIVRLRVPARCCNIRSLLECANEEPRKPDADALSFDPDAAESVVPVSAPDQREIVLAERTGFPQRAQAVLVNRRSLVRLLRQVIEFVFVGRELAHRDEIDLLVQQRRVASHLYVMRYHEREPDEIVRKSRAHAATALGMPPMLNITFNKLATSRADNMRACNWYIGIDERHAVLQLIAESV